VREHAVHRLRNRVQRSRGTKLLMRTSWRQAIVVLALTTLTFTSADFSGAQAPDQIRVFAAASLTTSITEIGALFSDKGKVTASFASSSALAKQIANGAPAEIFISADVEWMNYLAERRLIVPETRVDLLGNRLVLIAPRKSNAKVDISPGFPLAKVLGQERLAVGDPDHVPAGKYAKAALEKLGVWSQVASKLARADNVRAALTLVEREECPLGIVYSSDAVISDKVKVVGMFPQDSHPRIIYPAAIVSGMDNARARAFLEFLRGPKARAVFEKCGFAVY